MRYLVLSDSHGNIANMETAVERERPDGILHLGDCWRDAERLAERYPDILMEHVPGNCDCRPEEPLEKLVILGDCRVLLCHGHTYGVKSAAWPPGSYEMQQSCPQKTDSSVHFYIHDMNSSKISL